MEQSNMNMLKEAKATVVDSLPKQCKDVGNSFFTCVDDSITKLSSSGMNYNDSSSKLVKELIPNCMNKYNLEDCLKQNEH